MPANLPPEYFEAERKYREAATLAEKAEALETLISTIPKHKGTDKLRADYRRKLSQLKAQSHAKKTTGRHESHYHIEREGDARVVVIGAANVGKSALVATLTHASPEVSESPYSTWFPLPGMIQHEGVRIQLVDTPALDRDYIEPELVELIRSADLILIMLDVQQDYLQQYTTTMEVLGSHHIFPPQKKFPAGIPHPVVRPTVVAANKVDGSPFDEEFRLLDELLRNEGWNVLPLSVESRRNLQELLSSIIRGLRIVRVFPKPPGKPADRTRPFILHDGNTVGDLAARVHHDFAEKLKGARIWGKGVYDGQLVGRDHVLQDGDVIELHI